MEDAKKDISPFAVRLKQLRESRNLSQVELAEHLGTTKQTIWNYESGHREPGLSVIVAAANYFDVSTDYLLGKSDIENLSKTPFAEIITENLNIPGESINMTTYLFNTYFKITNLSIMPAHNNSLMINTAIDHLHTFISTLEEYIAMCIVEIRDEYKWRTSPSANNKDSAECHKLINTTQLKMSLLEDVHLDLINYVANLQDTYRHAYFKGNFHKEDINA